MGLPLAPMEARYDAFVRDTLAFALERAAALPAAVPYRFGPLRVDLQVEGAQLALRLTMAIRHAKCEPGHADAVRVVALDGAACGREPPQWDLPTYERRHLERLHVSPDRNRLLHHNPDTTNWTVFDREQNLALTWTASADLLPDWEDSFPLRTILHWMSVGRPCCLAHAAVVEKSGRGVLLTGRGGSGKSTTTVAAVLSGMRTCGDDFVMVDLAASGAIAYSLYDTVKLDEASLQRFAELRPKVANPQRAAGQKARVHLGDLMPDRLLESVPLIAIVQPVITDDAQPSLRKVDPGVVLRALAPSTLFLLRGEETILADKLAQLVRALPAWQLRLTRDPRASAAYLGGQLESWPW
jgi:hypothetical protein